MQAALRMPIDLPTSSEPGGISTCGEIMPLKLPHQALLLAAAIAAGKRSASSHQW